MTSEWWFSHIVIAEKGQSMFHVAVEVMQQKVEDHICSISSHLQDTVYRKQSDWKKEGKNFSEQKSEVK